MKKLLMLLISTTFLMGAVNAVAQNQGAAIAVGVVYSLNVTDPAAFVSSLSKYWDSETGKESGLRDAQTGSCGWRESDNAHSSFNL